MERLPARTKVLTVDMGTSYFKVSLFNHRGELDVLQAVPTPVTCSSGERAEIDAEAFRDCISGAVQNLKRQAGTLDGVKAVSFVTQTNSFALFDRANEPLTPFILWSDARARGEEALLEEFASVALFYQTTGVPQLNHLFLPAKLAWLHRYEQKIVESTARLGLISDYFTWWLTGRWWTEAAAAGLTGLANIHTLDWWREACSIAKISVDRLPRIVRAGTSAGTIKPEVTRDWGLPPDCQLIVGCLDQFGSAMGAGNVAPGSVSETTGTVLATVRCDKFFNPNPKSAIFQGPGFQQGHYYQLTFGELSAGILERYRNAKAPETTFAQLDKLAAGVPRGADGLRLRMDAFQRPVDQFFEGRTERHTRGHEVRAILEAVSGELCRQVRTLTDNVLPARVVAGGGAARSELWLRIKTEALGCPVVAADCQETASRGAALLAPESPQRRACGTSCYPFLNSALDITLMTTFPQRKVALSFLAYSDDAEFFCVGTSIRLAYAGSEVHIATDGDCGSDQNCPQNCRVFKKLTEYAAIPSYS